MLILAIPCVFAMYNDTKFVVTKTGFEITSNITQDTTTYLMCDNNTMQSTNNHSINFSDVCKFNRKVYLRDGQTNQTSELFENRWYTTLGKSSHTKSYSIPNPEGVPEYSNMGLIVAVILGTISIVYIRR